MPARIEKVQVIDFDGTQTETTTVTARCDGPNCQKPDSPCAGTLSWKEAKTSEEMANLPDGFYRIITQSDVYGSKKLFFSRNCQKEYMREYVPPKTPNEVKAEVEAAAAVLKKHQEEKESSQIAKLPDQGDQIAAAVNEVQIAQ